MKRIIEITGNILAFAITVMFFSFIVWAMVEGIHQTREHRTLIKETIGKNIVIQQDTLVIVNYQEGGFGNPSGFTLSNGVIVDKQYIKNYEIH